MLKDDPYDTRVEKPVRGGGYRVARALVRLGAFATRICIMAIALLLAFNFAAIIGKNARHSPVLTEQLMPVLERFWSIVPWGHIERLDVAVGARGIFYGDAAASIVPFVVVDAILDKIYDKLK